MILLLVINNNNSNSKKYVKKWSYSVFDILSAQGV